MINERNIKSILFRHPSFAATQRSTNSTSTHKQSNNMAAPAAAQPKTTYLDMVIEAIQALKDRKGASRSAIASWVQEHHQKEAGPAFNAYLRTAIKKGLESGVLKEGQSPQRFRIDQLPKVKK